MAATAAPPDRRQDRGQRLVNLLLGLALLVWFLRGPTVMAASRWLIERRANLHAMTRHRAGGACEAISLRRRYPDQVLGVAFRASQPSVHPLLQQGHEVSSLAVSQAHLYSPAADLRVAGPKVPGTRAFGPTASTARPPDRDHKAR